MFVPSLGKIIQTYPSGNPAQRLFVLPVLNGIAPPGSAIRCNSKSLLLGLGQSLALHKAQNQGRLLAEVLPLRAAIICPWGLSEEQEMNWY